MKGKYIILCFAFFLATTIQAQESAKEAMLKKRTEFNDRTMVQRFEKKLIPTADERRKRRMAYNEKREMLLHMIDTASMKEKYRIKLKYDVLHDPFSNRLQKFLSEQKQNTGAKEE